MEKGTKLKIYGESGVYHFIKYYVDMAGQYVICSKGDKEYTFNSDETVRFATPLDTIKKQEDIRCFYGEHKDKLDFEVLCKIEDIIKGELT